MLEEERKYEVDKHFALPDLTGSLPPGGRVLDLAPVTLTATYFDTDDLRLARAGVSLRHRRGDDVPWTVKLPAGTVGIRREVSRAGKRTNPPEELVALVTAYTRGAALRPVTTLRTVRQAYELRDSDDQVLAEIADDAVGVLDGRTMLSTFRELEVERKGGDRKLLDRVERLLIHAGAVTGRFTPKHIRALGPAAEREPDLVAAGPLPRKPTAGDVVTATIRRDIERLLTHDPLVRLGAPVGDDDTAVHQMRVGCRQLRSDLRTFGPLLDPEWAATLRAELSWLAGVLGGARDAEVLRDRLRRTAAADPICAPDPAAVGRMDAVLAARQRQALAAVDAALRSERYLLVVEALMAASRAPRLTPAAEEPAADVLPRLVSRRWRRLTRGGKGSPHAADLDPAGPDTQWHAVRINGKKARYAVEAVAPVVGGGATKLARSLSRVQTLLGEHQDAAVAAQTWVSLAEADPTDRELAVTAGRLFERERAVIRAIRADFPRAWARASKKSRTGWLR